MKYRKTNLHKRTTYTYYFADGERVTLYPESSRSSVDVNITICDDQYVSEDEIKELHRADDRWVYSNNKNCKAPIGKWEKPIIEAWKQSHPGAALPKRWHLSLEAVVGEEVANDKLSVLTQVSATEEEEPAEIERLHAIVDGFSDQEKRIYKLVLIQGVAREKVCQELRISEWTLRRRIKKIKNVIAADPVLKKIFGTS